MKPVVLLAYYYPPLTGVASERSAALARHLRPLGWAPTVVTVEDGHFHAASATGPDVRVERTKSIEVSRLLRSGYASATGQDPSDAGTLSPVETGGVGARLRTAVREYLYVPDAQIGWIPFAVHAAVRVVEGLDARPVILSSSVPFSAHFAAMRVARRFDLPWVAELRDPWTTCHPSLLPRSPLRRAIDQRLEESVLRAADSVVVTSQTTRVGLLAAHPGLAPERIDVVYNGFERPRGSGEPPGPEEAFDLLYAGTVAPGVSVAPLLEAIETIAASGAGPVRMRVLGPGGPWAEAADRMSTCTDWLSCEGVVSPAEAREAMSCSSVNVLLLPGDAHRDRLPGKLFEYLGAGRPILAIVPQGSEMEGLARQHGDVHAIGGNTAAEIAPGVSAYLAKHRDGRLQARSGSAESVRALTREAQARRMVEVLERATRHRPVS